MCFSAGASFGAGALLSVIGVASLKKVQQRSQIPFAAIPLIFAVQQITEGFLWLSFTHPTFASVQTLCTYVFLFFAQIVWPFWVPMAILTLDKKGKPKTAENLLLLLGTAVSLYLAYCLLSFHVESSALGKHISYKQHYPEALSRYGGILYIIATVVPPFLSPYKYMWSLGLAILFSYIITTIFYEGYVVSVWCFFASVISVAVLLIIRKMGKLEFVSKAE